MWLPLRQYDKICKRWNDCQGNRRGYDVPGPSLFSLKITVLLVCPSFSSSSPSLSFLSAVISFFEFSLSIYYYPLGVLKINLYGVTYEISDQDEDYRRSLVLDPGNKLCCLFMYIYLLFLKLHFYYFCSSVAIVLMQTQLHCQVLVGFSDIVVK